METKIIGISIGGTKTAVCYATIKNDEIVNIVKKQFPTSPLDPDKNFADICDSIDSYPQDFNYISVIAGSPMDAVKGLICAPSNLPGWHDYPLIDNLKSRYHCNSSLLNDADASALAEWKFGVGKGYKNFIYVTVGTGLGSGLILNGKLYSGTSFNAGEIGHVKVADDGYMPRNEKPGSAEGFVSGGGVGDLGKLLSKHRNDSSLYKMNDISARKVFEEARKGDKLANEIVDKCATKLGESISVLIDLLNPECIAIGGIYPRCKDLLEEKVLEVCKKSSLKINFNACKICPSKLEEKIDDYSSLMNYFNN